MTTTHRFKINATINTFHNGSHIHLSPQNFATENEALAKFLRRYPGVTYLGSEPAPAQSSQAGQFSPCPEPIQIVNGGFSGGGVQGIDKVKRR